MIQYLNLPKVALIDLDGAIIDATVRFKRAEDLRKAHPSSGSKASWNTYWEEALNPDFFYLDTPVPGALECLADLKRENYALIYITSRLEELRQPTATWLHGHGFPPPTLLLHKVNGFRFINSAYWYAYMAETLAFATQCRDLLIVSDKRANTGAMRSALAEAHYETARFYTSLSVIFDPAHGADDIDEARDSHGNPLRAGSTGNQSDASIKKIAGPGDAGFEDPFLPDFPDD